jgi:2-dehydro-3-deoxyphosphogluconate aldolase/(4S)-4-hydroxy-2-oxoglutarate aldolase
MIAVPDALDFRTTASCVEHHGMNSNEIKHQIESTGIVAIIRASGSGELIDVVKALREGGITCIEVTMTTPNCLDVI